VGGESGKNARPMNPNWVRKIRDQCVSAKVPFFFKQWGEWKPNCEMTRDNEYSYYEDEKIRIFGFNDKGCNSYKIGKKSAGNFLDGQVWKQIPS
jgi:protein gp37